MILVDKIYHIAVRSAQDIQDPASFKHHRYPRLGRCPTMV